ncbi:hypothetical protein A5780_07335 [Nocardia sp. 852002-20019_SCH5090214]|uniref:SMP-30/gluconolactonase/LRE family protein n=1 Tax=Nocardia sp. 852002-20019_SCH5090214 TaxID=1834087 RepID=UPI0007EA13A2|nr:SMP-30/gluconolactonase/LRE family protein [Nocardia sp. 852002-20019_SCH5090214]OBA40385.1 hypothetical protein A5780_07335 [Nocardia sp. 852002-20019_SCH5090214]
MSYEARIVATGFTFPETPRWHSTRQAFYFVDIDEGELFELKDRTARKLYAVDDFVSGMSFDDTDGFFVVSGLKRKILHLTGVLDREGKSTEFVDLSDRFAAGMNDMTRGFRGELYVGGFNFDALERFKDPTLPLRPGTFVRVWPDGRVEDVSGQVTFPNGIVIPPSGDRVLMADTYEQRISSWSMDPDGTLGEQTVWAEFGDESPDGICLDAEGALWIASNNHVIRVREGGEITDEIVLDEGHVTACALGGADGRTLLVTAAASIDRTVLHASRTGVLYEARVDVPGAGRPSLYK